MPLVVPVFAGALVTACALALDLVRVPLRRPRLGGPLRGF